ncbi:RND family transporter [Gymnodinialimonas hymeniacidonis]|uniref:efflux RND transporter permease subunit n=1 Tax=Gymnodinialimonas hymeniacidonis TaxID=3126508 RepID=UPI0034C6D146
MSDTTAAPTRTPQTYLAACLALVLTVLAVIGARDLQVEADVISALEGDSAGYLAYERFQDRFGLGVADEALLVRADDLADPEAFEALENLILDLQFTDGVAEVVSLFSILAEGVTTPLILADPDAALEDRFASYFAAGDAAGALVASDRSAALLHVIAASGVEPGTLAEMLPPLIDASQPLDVRAVGQQAVERQISTSLIRDQAVVTPLAVLICILVGWLIVRSFRAILICAVPSICGVLWFTGLLGWFGRSLDPWLATLPTLVMVLAFADTLHLFYASRERGMGLERAIREVLPAAFMTSLTSALALGSFAFVGTDALLGLAIWGPVAVGCGFASVCLIFPVLARLLANDALPDLRGFSSFLVPARAGLRHPMRAVIIGGVVVLALLPTLNRSEPSFSLSEHVRDTSPLGADLAFMEAESLGSASLFVEVADTDGTPGLSEADADRLSRVAEIALSGNATSTDGAPQVPERFRAGDDLSVALPVLLPLGTAPDRFGAELDALSAALDEAGLADVTTLAGQSLLSHEVVPETVASMRMSFYIALGAILLVVAVSQRSIVLAVLATGVSALPMMAIEAALVVTGQGMTMTVAFALTVAFGIAVDDTIHFLNRWRLSKGDRDARLADALTHAGPPMVASTLIMSLGFIATVFSATASLPVFGAFVIFSLWMALIVDLGFLPSLIRMVKR